MVETYHARDLEDRQVDAEGLMDDGVKIRKTMGELVVRRVFPMFEELVS